jgi:hypothetical protein
MPGNSTECRRNALRYTELAMAARTPHTKLAELERDERREKNHFKVVK